jgi:formylglycine-generating enzyme required for sulfatase activity
MGCDGVRDQGCEGNGLGGHFDKPYHRVEVPAFSIDKLETTVAEYAHCVAAGSCTLPEQQPECTWSAGQASNLPLTCVSWEQATAYCAWRGARLCTESEWEKASRGGCETLPVDQQADCAAHQRLNPWGDATATCDLAVMDEPTGSGGGCGTDWPLAVGSKPAGASPYGLLDAVGNVGEWVEDCFEQDYNDAPVDGSARAECTWPVGDWLSGKYRVHRGSGWNQAVWFQRGAQRGADPATGTFTNVGIRCCQP